MDDDPAFRRLAARMLADAGLELAGEAADAASGFAAALDVRPDAVLVDLRLPDRDGLELAHELLTLPWKPRVVLTSSDADAATTAAANGLDPVVPFVPKQDLPNATLAGLFGE